MFRCFHDVSFEKQISDIRLVESVIPKYNILYQNTVFTAFLKFQIHIIPHVIENLSVKQPFEKWNLEVLFLNFNSEHFKNTIMMNKGVALRRKTKTEDLRRQNEEEAILTVEQKFLISDKYKRRGADGLMNG